MTFEVTKMTLLDGQHGNTLAFAEVIADNAIVMRDIRVVSNKEGKPFVSFPDKKGKDGQYYKTYFIDHKKKGELYAKFVEVVLGQYFIRNSNRGTGGAMPPQEQQYPEVQQKAQPNTAPPRDYAVPGQARYGNYPESYTTPFDIEVDTQGAGALSQVQRGANPAMEGGNENERENKNGGNQSHRIPEMITEQAPGPLRLEVFLPDAAELPAPELPETKSVPEAPGLESAPLRKAKNSEPVQNPVLPEPKAPSAPKFNGITNKRLQQILSGKSVRIVAFEYHL
jgi:DNA-binding cell septation regulator SpoVG